MDLQVKREQLLAALEQTQVRIKQLQGELRQRQAEEQQIVGALMLCAELLAAQDGGEDDHQRAAETPSTKES